MKSSADQLLQLRTLLQERFPAAMQGGNEAAPMAPEIVPIKGKIVEIVSAAGCPGAGLVLLQLLAVHAQAAALVDGGDVFDPGSVPAAMLERLLWVRCSKVKEAIKAADLLLRDGNLRLVVLDLRHLSERELLSLPSSVWHRLRMLAEKSGAAIVALTSRRIMPCVAQRWVLGAVFNLCALEQEREALIAQVLPQPYQTLHGNGAETFHG